jgi:hypothetical protein
VGSITACSVNPRFKSFCAPWRECLIKCDFGGCAGLNWISGRGICHSLSSKYKIFNFETASALCCIVSEISAVWQSVMLKIRFTFEVSKSTVFITDEERRNCDLNGYRLLTICTCHINGQSVNGTSAPQRTFHIAVNSRMLVSNALGNMRKEASLTYYNSISVDDGLRKTRKKRTAGLQAILRSSTARHSTRITLPSLSPC